MSYVTCARNFGQNKSLITWLNFLSLGGQEFANFKLFGWKVNETWRRWWERGRRRIERAYKNF